MSSVTTFCVVVHGNDKFPQHTLIFITLHFFLSAAIKLMRLTGKVFLFIIIVIVSASLLQAPPSHTHTEHKHIL